MIPTAFLPASTVSVVGGGYNNQPRIIIYDDYNSNIPRNQDVIGTITTQFGNPAPRHGCKIIETMELYDCIYWNKSPHFQRPPLKNIGRTVTTDTHAPAVVVNNKSNMAKETNINLPEELKGKKFRIRKLTPRECFRLMGVEDADIDKIQATSISNSSQYRLAGNSIVVDVLYHLFRKMFIETEDENQQLSLF